MRTVTRNDTPPSRPLMQTPPLRLMWLPKKIPRVVPKAKEKAKEKARGVAKDGGGDVKAPPNLPKPRDA